LIIQVSKSTVTMSNKYKAAFRDEWLKDEQFSVWLSPAKDSKYTARCTMCDVNFNVGTMGKSALTSHTTSKKHKEAAQRRLTCVPINSLFQAPASPKPRATTLVKSVTKLEQLKADVIWCLKVVNSHYSYNSCENINKVFQLMFPDSMIATSFTCGATKCGYMAVYGLSPYFKSLLVNSVSNCDYFVLLFDESLNYENQKKQMDMLVRYWDHDKITSRYFGSEFMGHGNAQLLLDHFRHCARDLNFSKLLQVSVDGPNVNWKFHRDLQQQISLDCNNTLLDIGSCGLHILHGAFKTGFEQNRLFSSIQTLMTSLYYLFKDSPARKEDYTSVTSTTIFPLKFCKHRWLENLGVAQRALVVWDNVCKYIKAVKEKKFTEPTSKSYAVVKEASSDPKVIPLIHFYISVIRELQPFLVHYQCDKPMLPFLGDDLFNIIRSLMMRFIKADVGVTLSTPQKVLKLDVTKKENQSPTDKVKIGAACEEALKENLRSKKMSERAVMDFRAECKEVMIVLVSKLTEKSPLKYNLVRHASCLDPRKIVSNRAHCLKQMDLMLKVLADCNKITLDECDTVNSQYTHFLDMIVPQYHSEFRDFKPYEDDARVDVLLYERLNNAQDYNKLWHVVKMVLLVSHGQASVERGFSVNKQVAVENLEMRSFEAQRLICDHVRNAGGILELDYSNALLMAAAGARQKYAAHLDDLQRKKATTEKSNKQKRVEDEIDKLKENGKRLKRDMENLMTSSDKLADKAETTGKSSFIVEANSLRRTAKQKQVELVATEQTLDELLKTLKES